MDTCSRDALCERLQIKPNSFECRKRGVRTVKWPGDDYEIPINDAAAMYGASPDFIRDILSGRDSALRAPETMRLLGVTNHIALRWRVMPAARIEGIHWYSKKTIEAFIAAMRGTDKFLLAKRQRKVRAA